MCAISVALKSVAEACEVRPEQHGQRGATHAGAPEWKRAGAEIGETRQGASNAKFLRIVKRVGVDLHLDHVAMAKSSGRIVNPGAAQREADQARRGPGGSEGGGRVRSCIS